MYLQSNKQTNKTKQHFLLDEPDLADNLKIKLLIKNKK